jgi:superfamily I DNA/RNA helicase
MLILGRKYVDLENLKFLIVDEFQDISPLRASVIQNLRKKHNFKLFCVGDDWQSIYRFTGGEIGIMVFESEFEKYFGKRKIVDLEYTYRFGSRLCEAATNFILTNEKGQLKKAVKSIKTDNRPPIEIFLQEGVDNDFSVRKHVIKKLDELFEIHKNDEKPIKILFLSRFKTNTYYNFYDDLRQLVMRVFANKKFVVETMDYIRFSTVHKAKGVECDYVFLMNINNTRLGFPCNIDDDEILKLIINHIDAFPYEEERRTFYVALTRTKNRVFVYATKGDKISSFINEISGNQFKKNYHYISTEIEPLPKPKVFLEISSFKNIKNIKKEDHPAKKKGLEKDFLIEEINEIKHPTKDEFYEEVRNSKGKDITLLIRTHQNEPEVMKIKPINLSEEEDEEKYSLGFYVREIEQDPLFFELMDKYKKISKKRKSDKQ